MKASKYNYIVPFGEKKIFFNGITEAFFLVTPEYEESFRKIIESPDDNKDWAESFVARMKDSGFIIDDDTDELDVIKAKFDRLRNKDVYFLMILPTYQCNLRCWYCTQEHDNLFLNNDVVDSIKHLIVSKLSDNSIKRFHLSWFGGEPLMAYNKVCELTAFAKEYAESHDKSFSSSITTNGTLLNVERIETLRSLGVTHYQITIDGDRMTHNSVKKLGKDSAYDRTLDNINLIARHTSVSLRFNYTKENLKPDIIFETLREKLDPQVTRNIAFTIFKVWQQNQNEIDRKDVDDLFQKGIEAGMYTTLGNTGICYADWYNFDCVFPNGRVGKCDNHSPGKGPGILQTDGTISWMEDMSKYYTPHIFDDRQAMCTKCKHLPICWGPCISKREDMLRDKGTIECKYKYPDKDMDINISDFCKTKLQRTN